MIVLYVYKESDDDGERGCSEDGVFVVLLIVNWDLGGNVR